LIKTIYIDLHKKKDKDIIDFLSKSEEHGSIKNKFFNSVLYFMECENNG